MKVIGYIRVSNEKQDFESQKHLLLDYNQRKVAWVVYKANEKWPVRR
jgi:DNA invertase Pin-like site-specific DNA recombinase